MGGNETPVSAGLVETMSGALTSTPIQWQQDDLLFLLGRPSHPLPCGTVETTWGAVTRHPASPRQGNINRDPEGNLHFHLYLAEAEWHCSSTLLKCKMVDLHPNIAVFITLNVNGLNISIKTQKSDFLFCY